VLFLGGAAFVVITIAAAVQAWRDWRRPCPHAVTDEMTDREKFRTYLKHAARCERRPMSAEETAGLMELCDDEGDR
jgi:hypothetical protein